MKNAGGVRVKVCKELVSKDVGDVFFDAGA